MTFNFIPQATKSVFVFCVLCSQMVSAAQSVQLNLDIIQLNSLIKESLNFEAQEVRQVKSAKVKRSILKEVEVENGKALEMTALVDVDFVKNKTKLKEVCIVGISVDVQKNKYTAEEVECRNR